MSAFISVVNEENNQDAAGFNDKTPLRTRQPDLTTNLTQLIIVMMGGRTTERLLFSGPGQPPVSDKYSNNRLIISHK